MHGIGYGRPADQCALHAAGTEAGHIWEPKAGTDPCLSMPRLPTGTNRPAGNHRRFTDRAVPETVQHHLLEIVLVKQTRTLGPAGYPLHGCRDGDAGIFAGGRQTLGFQKRSSL